MSDPPSHTATASPPGRSPTPNATTTAIHGDATDFCSAFFELRDKNRAAKNSKQAVAALYESAADLERFAPGTLGRQVAVVSKGLKDVGLNLAVGLYPSLQELNNSLNTVLASPEFQAVAQYIKTNCPTPP